MAPKEESAELKAKGNKYFASHEWLNAIDSYTKAIEMYDQDPSYYCNRAQVISPESHNFWSPFADVDYSQANIKLEQYGYAIADAAKAIELDSGYAKVCDVSHRKNCRLLMHYRHTTGEQSRTPRFSTPVPPSRISKPSSD